MDIQFDGQYNRKIFRQALRLVQQTTWINKILRYAALGAALVLIISYAYTWLTDGLSAGYRLLAAILLLAYATSPAINTWRVMARLFKDRPMRAIGGRVNSLGLILASKMVPGKHRQMPWKEFRRAGQTDTLTSLLANDGTLWVFQRNFFARESDWNRFQQLVRKNVTTSK